MSRRSATMLVGGALAAVVLSASVGWMRGRGGAPSPPRAAETGVIRLAIDADSGPRVIGTPAISADGRTLVYLGTASNGTILLARRMDELTPRPLKGTEYAESPFFSPDGTSIAYAAKGAIWKLRLDGGRPELVSRLDPAQDFAGGTWGTNDEILYAVEQGGLFRVAAGGGEPARVQPAESTVRLLQPHLLPGARAALVTVARAHDTPRVGVIELSTGRVREFGEGAGARFAAGNVVFARRGGDLYRQPFDPVALQPTGAEVLLERALDPSAESPVQLGAIFDLAATGTVAYRAVVGGDDDESTQLLLTDRAGRVERAIPARVPWSPRFSPDGRRLAYGAFAEGRSGSEIWITDLASGATQQLTSDGRDNNDPRWRPDGGALAYSAQADNGKDLFVQPLTGARAQQLTSRDGSEWPSGWTSDGLQVVFTQWSGADQRDVWLQPASGAPPSPVVATGAQETAASISPDGRWIAYQSDESGRPEVYVQSYPRPGVATRISTVGGVSPIWRGDGGELYYWQDDRLFAVPVLETPPGVAIALGARTALFRAAYVASELPMYDVSRDGTRFALVSHGVRAARLVVAAGLLGGGGM